MKKKLILIPLLVLTLVLSMGMPVLAWYYEDPCVASSEDFIWGVGWEGNAPESYYGGQSWSYFSTPNDGYNLYRDDVSGTGNLDKIWSLITRTPNVIDLPNATIDYYDLDGGFYYMTSETSDACYYWAMEPRGKNQDTSWMADHIQVIGAWGTSGLYEIEFDGTLLEEVSILAKFNDITYKLDITKGTKVTGPDGSKAIVLFLMDVVDDQPYITSTLDFSEACVLSRAVGTPQWYSEDWLEGIEWIEVCAFTHVDNCLRY